MPESPPDIVIEMIQEFSKQKLRIERLELHIDTLQTLFDAQEMRLKQQLKFIRKSEAAITEIREMLVDGMTNNKPLR